VHAAQLGRPVILDLSESGRAWEKLNLITCKLCARHKMGVQLTFPPIVLLLFGHPGGGVLLLHHKLSSFDIFEFPTL
jgi:hypothetical protein